jgi:hypothetical protein
VDRHDDPSHSAINMNQAIVHHQSSAFTLIGPARCLRGLRAHSAKSIASDLGHTCPVFSVGRRRRTSLTTGTICRLATCFSDRMVLPGVEQQQRGFNGFTEVDHERDPQGGGMAADGNPWTRRVRWAAASSRGIQAGGDRRTTRFVVGPRYWRPTSALHARKVSYLSNGTRTP